METVEQQYEVTEEQYKAAIEKVKKNQQVSVSMIQRMGVGYVRAAKIVDRMEDEGLIGPYRGSKPRQVFIK